MIVLPFLTVKFAGINGMAICFILFYAINPIFCLLCGIYAGRRWYIPVVNAVLFLVGVCLFFTINEPAFLWYSIAYLLIGYVAMFVKKYFRG